MCIGHPNVGYLKPKDKNIGFHINIIGCILHKYQEISIKILKNKK